MAHANLTLLGGFHVRLDSAPVLAPPAKKAQALLAYLAARLGQACPRDTLLALLWGDTAEARARNSLRQALFTLRKSLPAVPPSFLIERDTIALNPAAVDVDVASFQQLAGAGTPEALERAAALYQGDLLAGFSLDAPTFEEWLLAERERLHEVALRVLAKLLAHQNGSRQSEAAIQTAIRILALDPLQEPVHRTLMLLYTQQEQWAAAFRQYHVCVGLLQRELGVDPEAETKKLYHDLLQKRGVLAPSPSEPPRQDLPRARHKRIRSGQSTPVPETPLVGRERELASLRAVLEETWHGNGRVVVVLGEAGIGKSRLVEEIRSEAVKQRGQVLIGRSYESEQILPFGPWVDALRRGHVVSELESLAGLSPSWCVELARLFPELAVPDLHPPADVADPLRLFEALAQLVAHLAARQPLLLVLEDLHWADEMSLRYLAFIGRRIRIWPMLVVVTARAEELHTAPALCRALEELKQDHCLLELPLLPFTPLETVAFVRMLMAAEGGPAAIVAQLAGPSTVSERPVSVATVLAASATELAGPVWRVSEGNPFMIVETFRALREMGTTQASALKLPARIREVIVGRLERLNAHARELVAAGAVIGREFDFPLLQRASGLGERETAERLEELVRRRVLHVIGDRFDFTHDRIREVAYQQLLPARRELLHRQVAEAIEEISAKNLEPHALALGNHYREARVWSKALAYFRQAGDLAFTRSANREAVTCFEHALGALSHSPENRETLEQAVDLRFRLRNALWPLGELTEMFQRLREAQRLVEMLDDHRRHGWLSSYMAQCFWMVGEADQAIEWGERALASPTAMEDLGLQVGANLHLGIAYHALGQYHRAVEVLTRNVERLHDKLAYERFGLAALPSVYSRTWVVWSLAEMGEFDAGFACTDEAIKIAERSDQPLSRTCAYLGLGLLCLQRGETKKAIAILEEALGICRAAELMLWLPYAAAFLGWGYALSGRLADGLPLLESAVEQSATRRLMASQAPRVAWLGEANLYAGRMEDAGRLADSALDLARRHKERGHEAWVLRLLGEIASRCDPPARGRAEGYYCQAANLAEELGMRPLVAHCRFGLGRLYGGTGAPLEAAKQLTMGVAMYSEMEMPFWLERAEAALTGL